MIGHALKEGFKSATRRPGLVALLWAWNLGLAALAALPFWAWISAVSGASPQTDVLLDGADLGIITQLMTADPRVALTIAAAAAGVALAALVSGALVSGGLLEVVVNDADSRPLLHRFFRGAGHFFGRFLRLLVVAGVTIVAAVAIVGAILTAVTRPLTTSGSEPASLWASLIVRGGMGLAVAYFLLAHDYARAATVLSGSPSMIRAWLRALVFVLRRTPAVATIALLAAVGVLATVSATIAFDVAYSARTWAVILAAIVLHQAMAFVRTAVRVGQVSAQADYCRARLARRPEPADAGEAAIAAPDTAASAGSGSGVPLAELPRAEPAPASETSAAGVPPGEAAAAELAAPADAGAKRE